MRWHLEPGHWVHGAQAMYFFSSCSAELRVCSARMGKLEQASNQIALRAAQRHLHMAHIQLVFVRARAHGMYLNSCRLRPLCSSVWPKPFSLAHQAFRSSRCRRRQSTLTLWICSRNGW